MSLQKATPVRPSLNRIYMYMWKSILCVRMKVRDGINMHCVAYCVLFLIVVEIKHLEICFV